MSAVQLLAVLFWIVMFARIAWMIRYPSGRAVRAVRVVES